MKEDAGEITVLKKLLKRLSITKFNFIDVEAMTTEFQESQASK